jgi:hypothetical protein
MQREENRGLILRANSFSPSVGSAAEAKLVAKRRNGRRILKVREG